MSATSIRLCPACRTENPPSTLRCACGLLLTGIDLSERPAPASASAVSAPPPVAAPAQTRRCPHADCAQDNPENASECLYCNRPLNAAPAATPAAPTLISLPSTLRERFRIVRALPTAGMEADLLVVEPLSGGAAQIAKIYRHGLRPKPEVLERVARLDVRHCVKLDEYGDSGGFAYELMEYCPLGSLRERLRDGAIDLPRLMPLIAELAGALAAVHAAGLIHRDLKPENILLRQLEPLDLVLTDFGIASLHQASLRFTNVARSVAYAAPESLSGVVDVKTDYWALGMIVLEAATGAHPFAGLSEPVILHRLTTRSIDLAAIAAPRLQLLLAGLLARDPKIRWGEPEIARWLRGDRSLRAPAAANSATHAPHAPYRIADTLSETPEQLAAALAAHWQAGVDDLDNGQLLHWFRQELKDQNLVRLLVDINLDRQQHVDRRLLRLIIQLAPGMPPMWRGAALDLGNILRHADAALRGDAPASEWLDSLYQHRVLQAWSEAGNAEAGDLLKRWQQSAEQFETAWLEAKKLLAHPREKSAVADFDALVYGHLHGPSRPPWSLLHPRLLALTYDAAWGQRLRQHVASELATLAIDCPWLGELGDPQSLAAHRVLVIEALLPEARKIARRAQERQVEARQQAEAELAALASQTLVAIENLRSLARKRPLDDDTLNDLRDGIAGLSALNARQRALGAGHGSDEARRRLRQVMARAEPLASRLLDKTAALAARRAENSGWLNPATLGFAALTLLLTASLLSPRWLLPLMLLAGALAAWRLLPNHFLAREIRRLGLALRSEGLR